MLQGFHVLAFIFLQHSQSIMGGNDIFPGACTIVFLVAQQLFYAWYGAGGLWADVGEETGGPRSYAEMGAF